MARPLIEVFAVLTLAVMLAGCWDAQDISDLNIPIVGGYDLPDPVKDKDVKDATVVVTGLMPNLDPQAGEKVRVDRIAARTVGESRGIRGLHNADAYNVGMVQVAIYGEDLARRGLDTVNDALYREEKTKRTIYMAVVDGRADELLQTETEDYQNLGIYLLDLLRHAQERNFIPGATLSSYGVDEMTAGKNPVLPLVRASGERRLELAGAGIFKKGRLAAKILLRDTRSLVLLRGLPARGEILFVIRKDGQTLDLGTVEVSNSRKVRVERTGDQLTFLITVRLKGRLVDHSGRVSPVRYDEALREIDRAVADEILDDCGSFVNRMQNEFGIDCIDITKYALARWRGELQDAVDEDGFIKKARIVVDVKVDISSTGERR